MKAILVFLFICFMGFFSMYIGGFQLFTPETGMGTAITFLIAFYIFVLTKEYE